MIHHTAKGPTGTLRLDPTTQGTRTIRGLSASTYLTPARLLVGREIHDGGCLLQAGIKFPLGAVLAPNVTIVSALLSLSVIGVRYLDGNRSPASLRISLSASGTTALYQTEFTDASGNVATLDLAETSPHGLPTEYAFDVTGLIRNLHVHRAYAAFVQLDDATARTTVILGPAPSSLAAAPALRIHFSIAESPPGSHRPGQSQAASDKTLGVVDGDDGQPPTGEWPG